jgi:hypothetical protein
MASNPPDLNEARRHEVEARRLAEEGRMPFPTTPGEAKQPHPIIRPLVLRANLGETVEIDLHNDIRNRHVGMHLVGSGYDVKEDDGSKVGANPSSLAPPDQHETYRWICGNEGVFPFHDGGDYSGGEDGTNVHGLFGALVVEPVGAIWRDPISGRDSTSSVLDGLYLDVIPPEARNAAPAAPAPSIKGYEFEKPRQYHDFTREAHREFVVFFHDEPEFVPPHTPMPADPCAAGSHGGHGGHGGHGELPPIMPVSYRAEPMINREHVLFKLINEGHDFKGRPVLNEEQHHSSWMFGDPVTPIFKAYIGDPVASGSCMRR